MPDYFTRLLKSNMQTGNNLYSEMILYCKESPPLDQLIKRTFKNIDSEVRIEFFLKSLGWNGFRDRLASVFLYYSQNGEFPLETNIDGVESITLLERKLKSISISDYSRAFMLGFYLELAKGKSSNGNPLELDDEFFKLVNMGRNKVIKVDFFVIALAHIKDFFGHAKVKKLIDNEIKYEDLYSLLTDEQKALMLSNMINYGTSIGETEIFCSKTI